MRRLVPTWRPDRRSALTVAVAVLPILVAAVRALAQHRAPIGDDGLIALRANDVLTSNHPWYGTWTSASLSLGKDLNNPSPLHFELLGLFVRPFGLIEGPVLGAAAINIAAVALAVRQGFLLAGRRGEALFAFAAVALTWSLGSELLVDIWQPHNLVLPFLAFLACVASAASGRWSSLAWAVGVGSMVMGAHLSFTYLVLALVAGGLAACCVQSRGGWRRGVAVAASVGLLAWLQPILEQLFGRGEGNLARILGQGGGGGTTVGGSLGARLVARVVALPPWWGRSSFTDSVRFAPVGDDGRVHPSGLPGTAVAVISLGGVMVLLAVLVVIAHRAGRVASRALAGTALAAVTVAVLSTVVVPLGVIGLAPHQFRWLWPISVLVTVAIVDGVHSWVAARGRSLPVSGSVVALAVSAVLVVAALPAHDSDLGPNAARGVNDTVRSLMVQLEQVRLPGPAWFDGSTLAFAEPYSGPLLAALADADQPIRSEDESFARQIGEGRRRRGDERWSIQIRTGSAAVELAEGEQYLATATDPSGVEVAVVLIPSGD